MEKEGDRSTHITGPVTKSPISSGDFLGPVTYDYSGHTIINFNFYSIEARSALEKFKRTPEKEFQIEGSSGGGGENISKPQDLKSMEALIKMFLDVVRSKEKEIPGIKIEGVTTNTNLQFSRDELLIKEAFVKGNKYVAMGWYNEAISSYDTILELNPNHDVALNNKAAALAYLGQPSQALPYIDKALSINPNNTYAWANKAHVFLSMGRNYEAVSYSDKALSINPNNDMALNNKGAALGNLGQPSQALPYIDKALSINPNNPYAWANKATILNALGRFIEATGCVNRARQLGLSV